jgi:hypothetical protein
MEREDAEFRAANERITTMAEELRKAELVRDRLEDLARLMGSYPEGHDMRARLEALHVNRALEAQRRPPQRRARRGGAGRRGAGASPGAGRRSRQATRRAS